jgi:hypothetical protein
MEGELRTLSSENEPIRLDEDAIRYSARFYGALADGQSIGGAHDLAKAGLQLSETPDFDLPTLYSHGADPRAVIVVLPL